MVFDADILKQDGTSREVYNNNNNKINSVSPQPSGQSAGHGGARATNRPGDHRGYGPSHSHQLLRHAELREPQDGRHQELVAGRPAGREAVQRGLQVRGTA